MEESRIKRTLYILIIISTIVRIIIAFLTELGNDEVYYWTYALFPSMSYFDHPPMVGYMIWITTLGTNLHNEFFVRLGAIAAGSINLWLIFKIGRLIKDSRTGLYASLLYAASLYGSVITGTFILPDSPQVVFWLLSLFLFLKSIVRNPEELDTKKYLVFAGLAAGFAMLSKYHSAFLWLGALLYIFFYNRKWLKTKELYFSILISFLIFLPVLFWNYREDFISFRFHSGRVGLFAQGININTFLQEVLGQIFYNNPVNFILIAASLYALLKNKLEIIPAHKRFLLLAGFPIILLFLFFSLSSATFPHWSAPGYFSLILIASVWLSGKELKRLVPASIKFALSLIAVTLVFGLLTVNYGIFSLNKGGSPDINKTGGKDVSLEMYGWKQIGEEFKKIYDRNNIPGNLMQNAPVAADKWYTAAHIDYYAAYPLSAETYAIGNLNDIRNYYFVNRKRKGLNAYVMAYYITTSHEYIDPSATVYQITGAPDTIKVYRNNDIAEYAYVYKLRLYNTKP